MLRERGATIETDRLPTINLNKLSEDFTEIIARHLLHLELFARGDAMPNTDHWHDLYSGRGLHNGKEGWGVEPLSCSYFRAKVDGLVHLLITHTIENMK